MRHAAQELSPALAVKVPSAHAVHTRSDVAVAAALRYMPASHAALTDSQAAPSLVLENAEPEAQASQTRSAVAEPAVSWPWPAAHVLQATQAWLPELILKVSVAQAVHVRSDDTPGAAVWYSPTPHVVMAWHTRSDVPVGAAKVYWPVGHVAECVAQSRSLVAVGSAFSNSPDLQVVTATHALPSLAAEYVVPGTHAAHWRSAEAEPAAVMPCPARHIDQGLQLLRPDEELYVPSAHAAHSRSLKAVAAAVVKLPAAHAALTVSHSSPLTVLENVSPSAQTPHTRSCVAAPGLCSPSPIGHVDHGEHSSRPADVVNVP
jgi:hypothetical protein